jgi:hypothetical protein
MRERPFARIEFCRRVGEERARMTQNSRSGQLREDIVKKSLEDVDWPTLKAHLDAIAFTADALTELCGHIQRFSD